MDVKTSIRERRQNRIRAIQSRSETRYAPSQDIQGWGAAHELPGTIHENGREYFSVDPQNDSEYAWRNKEQQLISQWRVDDSGGGGSWKVGPTRRQLWMKLILSVMLYVLVIGMFQLQNGWAAEGKRFVRAALTEDVQVEAVAAWYQRTFSGVPSFIPAFITGKADKVVAGASKAFHIPVKGVVIASYAGGHPFVELKTKADATVVTMDTGLVVFAGMLDGLGYSVTIQHAGGYQSTYSGLRSGKWQKDDWVNGGDPLGIIAPTEGGNGIFKFVVLKDREYINPADVVSLD